MPCGACLGGQDGESGSQSSFLACKSRVWAKDKIIVNVGCNKGHDSIAWLERFDQSGFWNLAKWTKQVEKYGRPVCCSVFFTYLYMHSVGPGHLNPKIPKPPKFDSAKGPRAVCIEGLISTSNALNASRSELGFDVPPGSAGILHIVNAAVSDEASPGQTVQFLDVMPGSEMGVMVDSREKRPTVSVPLATVDGIVAELQLPRVDILLVDTEGADPLVLKGANKSLESVRYIMFETHRDKTLPSKKT